MGQVHVLEVWGDLACFTRPEMKVERFSYPVITPSAARAVFDAIYWEGKSNGEGIRPYFYWQIRKIEVLASPRYIALRRNEVKEIVSVEAVKRWMRSEPIQPIVVDVEEGDQKGRTQRQTMALKDVRYRLHAEIIPKGDFRNDINKFNNIFRRRASRGQCFWQPYLGCREFPAYFRLVDESHPQPEPYPLNLSIGWMVYDVCDLREALVKPNQPPFISLFEATVTNGVLIVPEFESTEVRKPLQGV